MNTINFAKGVGVGIIVGSAIGVAVAQPHKKSAVKKNFMGRALRTVGDIVENIGDSFCM